MGLDRTRSMTEAAGRMFPIVRRKTTIPYQRLLRQTASSAKPSKNQTGDAAP
jgi:hypothetical protein